MSRRWKITRKNFFSLQISRREISQFFTSLLPKTMRQRPVIDSTSVFFAIVVVKNTNNSLSSSVTRAIYGFSAFPFSSCLSLPMNYRAWFWHIAKLQQFNFWCDFRTLSQRIKQKILKNQSLDDDDDDIDREKMHEHNRNLIESLNYSPICRSLPYVLDVVSPLARVFFAWISFCFEARWVKKQISL